MEAKSVSKSQMTTIPAADGQPKHAALRELLLQQIASGALPAGSLVPSENSLVTRFGVSSTTVRRCLNDLEKEGYVSRHRGRGTFVSESARVGLQTSLGLLCSSLSAAMRTTFASSLLAGLEKYAGNGGHAVNVYTSHLLEQVESPALALRQLTQRRGLRGLFVISPMPEPWFADLVKEGFPLVSVNVDFKQLPVARVMVGVEKQLDDTLAHLMGLGHRRIAMVTGFTPGSTIEGTASRVERRAAEIVKSHPDVMIDWYRYSYFDPQEKQRIATRLLSLEQGRPTAVIVAEDSMGDLLWAEADRRKLRVPADLSIASLQGLDPYSRLSAAITPLDNICWRAVRIMEQLLAGESPAQLREIVEDGFVVRESTAACS